MKMYLLCKRQNDRWDVLSAYEDKSILDNWAEMLNWAEYKELILKFITERGNDCDIPLPPDDPKRFGVKTYFVQEVPVFPIISFPKIEGQHE